jgi:hypothetical protein
VLRSADGLECEGQNHGEQYRSLSERRLVFHQGPSIKTEAHLSELRRPKSPARFRLRMTILLVFIMRLREVKKENGNTYI